MPIEEREAKFPISKSRFNSHRILKDGHIIPTKKNPLLTPAPKPCLPAYLPTRLPLTLLFNQHPQALRIKPHKRREELIRHLHIPPCCLKQLHPLKPPKHIPQHCIHLSHGEITADAISGALAEGDKESLLQLAGPIRVLEPAVWVEGLRVWVDLGIILKIKKKNADGGASGQGVVGVDDGGVWIDPGEAAGDAGAEAKAFVDAGGEEGEFFQVAVADDGVVVGGWEAGLELGLEPFE